jgi:hypothetical protein
MNMSKNNLATKAPGNQVTRNSILKSTLCPRVFVAKEIVLW